MIVHRSNRIEALVDGLAELVARPLPDPFAAEWIAVQGRGMERWLAQELARRLGIWANPRFPFPRRVIETATTAVLGEAAPEPSVFDPERLRWAIAEMLPQHLGHKAFAPIRRFLADDSDGAKCLQLAGRIADLFDQYAVYRPHLVLAWEDGKDSDWQADLWRALVRAHGTGHAAARARALLAALADGRRPDESFPPRVSLFGLSTLPPLYVEILAALARTVEMHLFVLSPSREFWGEIRSRRDRLRALARRGQNESLASDEGHPLLASLGRVGRDFQQVLESLTDYEDDPADRYVTPAGTAMLAVLQRDILELRTRAPDADAAEDRPVAIAPGDGSIAVHACHSPMREVEVLHDQLLALFDADATLAPPDVIVMTPSIETYAPLIEAVFGSDGRPEIPFRIADRRPRAQHDVLDAFLRALELVRGRMPAPAVLDLLALEPVRERFGIVAEELERLRRWVAESGIRWGADADHRAEAGQPPCADNTWRFGLDRLLVGYALPGREAALFAGVLPHDDVEGSDTALLGRLAALIDTLSRFRTAVAAPRHPAEWRAVLGELLAALVAQTPATAHQHQAIAAALDALAERAAAAGFAGAVTLDTMRGLLEREIERAGSARGFLTGAVTFCEMVPMRTIPFRVVSLLGLHDGAFPRARRPLSFDRIAEHPEPGDRSARDDDRYLFLEALLSARDHLVITYVGQSIADNGALPPSVVVNELLDAVDCTFTTPEGTPPHRRIVQRHALQPFSPHYFGRDPDGRAFSYSRIHHAGAVALAAPRQPRPPVLAAPLPVEPVAEVTLDDLVRFFSNPSRWFLQHRLGVFLGRDAEPLEEREPIDLDHLERWQIGDALLRQALDDGRDPAELWAVWRARGTLPLGTPGRCVYDAVAAIASRIGAAASAARGGARLPVEEIALAVGDLRLVGELRNLWPGGQIAAQYSKIRNHREVELWIRHLVRAAAGSGAPSALFGRDDDGAPAVAAFAPVADPHRYLAELVRLFQLGQRVPLPFFRGASRKFAERLARPTGALVSAWADARAAFGPGDRRRGKDVEDAYVAELYPGGLPVDGLCVAPGCEVSFADAARTVFGPFFAHRTERAA